jgi:hypothetical protein
MPLLRVFYGDQEKFAEARSAMMQAWRRTTGSAEEPAHGPREIETKEFADFVYIVDLSVSRPVAGNIEGTLTVPYTLRIHPGTTDERGRIDGSPLRDEPTITMEPVRPNVDGPITFQLSVPREGFVVTLCDASGDVSVTQKVVLDAIFAQGIAMDKRKRLIVASETVRPPASKAAK